MDLFQQRDGKSYWRCGWCGMERAHPESQGSYVTVGGVVRALVCTEECEAPAGRAIENVLARHVSSLIVGSEP